MPLRCSLPPTARTRRASRNRPRPVKSSQIGISSASNIASKSVARSAAIRRTIAVVYGLLAGPGFLIDLALVFPGMSRRCPSSYLSSKSCTRTRRIASRHDLDLGAEGLRREAAVPPDAERALPAVKGHDPAQDLDAVLSGPHHPGSQELPRMVRFGEVHDRLVAVLLELALAERSHNSGHLALCHTRRHRPMGYKASGCAPTAARRSVQEPVRLELGGDLLDGVLDVRRFAGPRADDLAAAEHQEDDLRLVDAIDEARELLRFVFDGTGPEGDRDRVEVERGAEVRRGDDVLDLDLRVLLDRDACGLDLLRDEVDRRLHVLEALRAGADDLPAAEEEDRALRLLDPIDEVGELLRLVLGAAQGEGDRLEVELAPEGGRCDDVLDPVLGHGEPPRSACTPSRSDDTGHNWWLICFGATA